MVNYPFWEEGIHEEFDKMTVHEDRKTCLNNVTESISKNIEKLQEIKILDIGCGDGSTTRQLLDEILKAGDCRIVLDVIEPGRIALNRFDKIKENFNKKITTRKIINDAWKPGLLNEKYDLIFLVHTLYYIADSEKEYEEMLKSILNLLNDNGICIIFLLPRDSDCYNIPGFNAYGDWTYSEETRRIIERLRYKADILNFRMRISVQDISSNDEKLLNLWRFTINNLNAILTESKKKELINKIRELSKRFEGKYIDFKDKVIFVSNASK